MVFCLARQESAALHRGVRAGTRSNLLRTGLAGLSLLLLSFLHGCVDGGTTYRPVSAVRLSTGEETLREACAYLWSKQGPDGGWHSQTYAYLRSGQALTPFVLHALLRIDPEVVPLPATRAERALAFMRDQLADSAEGSLGLSDPDVVEYPNHATAYALRCLVEADRLGLGESGDRKLIERMRRYLIGEQYRAENGFDGESPVHGGWGFGGFRPRGSPGHMDLSYTRHVLEALRQAGEVAPEVFERAEVFLRFVQKHPTDRRPQPPDGVSPEGVIASGHVFDGGFYFSPVVGSANKGGLSELPAIPGTSVYPRHRVYRSYATATCDGVLALLAAGVPVGDERLESARRWLESHPRVDYPEGIPRDEPNGWADAVHFYHLAVRAEAYEALEWPGGWRGQLVRALASLQRDDGSFRNDRNSLMKEDDSLVATALALVALRSGQR